jgi:TonB family protein
MSDMSNSITERLSRNSFWLSILLHILFLLFVLIALMSQSKQLQEQKQLLPHYYVPAYTYTGSIKPASAAQNSQSSQASERQEHNENSSAKVQEKTPDKFNEKSKSNEEAENIQSVTNTQSNFQVPKVIKKTPSPTKNLIQKSFLADSLNMLKNDQMNEISKKKEADPILLIGDDTQPADPLIKLLGRSLSAHFRYPRMAGQLGVTGRVIIALTLHPEGYYSDVQMVQSSDNQELDTAALYAVNSAPTVEGADRFISQPKHFVIGFVFDY